MFDKNLAYSLVSLIDENLKTIQKRTKEIQSPEHFVATETRMILLYQLYFKMPYGNFEVYNC